MSGATNAPSAAPQSPLTRDARPLVSQRGRTPARFFSEGSKKSGEAKGATLKRRRHVGADLGNDRVKKEQGAKKALAHGPGRGYIS
jgi:hypothetical protein